MVRWQLVDFSLCPISFSREESFQLPPVGRRPISTLSQEEGRGHPRVVFTRNPISGPWPPMPSAVPDTPESAAALVHFFRRVTLRVLCEGRKGGAASLTALQSCQPAGPCAPAGAPLPRPRDWLGLRPPWTPDCPHQATTVHPPGLAQSPFHFPHLLFLHII